MIVESGVKRHIKDCSIIDYETVRSPLEPQALSVLLQSFTHGGTKHAMKVEAGKLREYLGITEVSYVEGNSTLAVVDAKLGEAS